MPTSSDLVATILNETLACQDPTSSESRGRAWGQYAPLGPYIVGEGGGYPTTDAAMAALVELADRYRANNAALARSTSRDALRMLASRVMGEILCSLVEEQDSTRHWPLFRERLKARSQNLSQDMMHYVPVWLFLGQTCAPFAIGPVRFVHRGEWLAVIAARRGQESSWMAGVRTLWAGGRLPRGSLWAGLRGVARAVAKSPAAPVDWARAFCAARRFSRPTDVVNAETVARLVHPDQWIACAEVPGFEPEESRRRGILAARVALDTIRLVLPSQQRRLLSTAADSTVPLSVHRLNQVAAKDLAHGWRLNRPGVSGGPGLAQELVLQSAPLFEAAGTCIGAAVNGSSENVHACPILADRWFNAVHWFGRACIADVDFVAVVMLVIALDVLCGGKQEQGIVELTARLTGTAMSSPVLLDGTNLKKLVAKTYKLRSEVAHGSALAVHATLDVERAQFESLAAAALSEYAVHLQGYSEGGGFDDRDAFLSSLPPAKP